MLEYFCPICKTVCNEETETCPNCHSDVIIPREKYSYYDLGNNFRNIHTHDNQLLKIYKYSKKIALGEIAYKPSELDIQKSHAKLKNDVVNEIIESRGIAYINDPNLMLLDAVIPLSTGVYSLILNVKGATSRFLEDAEADMILLGKDFEVLTDGYLFQHHDLRYIWVHPDNPYFCAENNVLFNKNKTELICYARNRPEEEYIIPRSVKRVSAYTFNGADRLKKLYVYKGSEFARTIASKVRCEVIFLD